jgi:hypothetical protein
MKAAALSEIKQELTELPQHTLLELCTRLIKYKKENKELITYLLFEMEDENAYIQGIQAEILRQFRDVNKSNMYLAKKSLRKVLRMANKYIKYSGIKKTEIEVLIYYCHLLKMSGIPIKKDKALHNIYLRQIQKIQKAVSTLHEDLQYDYQREVQELGM